MTAVGFDELLAFSVFSLSVSFRFFFKIGNNVVLRESLPFQ